MTLRRTGPHVPVLPETDVQELRSSTVPNVLPRGEMRREGAALVCTHVTDLRHVSGSLRSISVRRCRRHRRRGRPEARAHGGISRLALARPAPRRIRDLERGGDARAVARGWRLRDLAARRGPGMARAALRPRCPADRDVARHRDGARRGRRAAPRRRARLARVRDCERRSAPERTRSSSARSSASSSERTRLRSCGSAASTAASTVIEAVVFDLDGVLVDSEHVWDEVREQLARERGGRWHERAQADMMGMSSPEWSQLHARRGRARRAARGRSTTRWSAGC